MAADAKLRVHDGSASTAADQIAAMYRMSEHLGTDATIISSLVGQVIFEAADQVAESGIDRGVFGPAESTAMRDGLKQMEQEDPFSMIGAIETEQRPRTGPRSLRTSA
jgi:tartrate dehydratase beta subunit/fumarate hydratase class I family protein